MAWPIAGMVGMGTNLAGGLLGAISGGGGGRPGLSQEQADQWNLYRDASSEAANQARLAAQGIGGLISGMPGAVQSPLLSLDPLRRAWAMRDRMLRGDLTRMAQNQQAGRGFGTFNAGPALASYNADRAQQLGQAEYNLPVQQYGLDRQAQQDAVRGAQVGANLYGQQANLYGQRPGYLQNPLMIASQLFPGQNPPLTGFERFGSLVGGAMQGAGQGLMGAQQYSDQTAMNQQLLSLLGRPGVGGGQPNFYSGTRIAQPMDTSQNYQFGDPWAGGNPQQAIS